MGNSDPTPIGAIINGSTTPNVEPIARPTPMRPTEEQIAHAFKHQCEGNWRSVVGKIGDRYAECSFDNFQLSEDPAIAGRQQSVINRLTDHLNNPKRGRNVVFYGPKGTGKDHLMAAAMRFVCLKGIGVTWINGMDLFSSLRDLMDTDRSEASYLKAFTDADLLAISDPLPPTGELTAYQRQTLFQIVDRRYRDLRPVWVTMNFGKANDAEERMGPQIVDRLRHDALALFCDWPSYRKPGA